MKKLLLIAVAIAGVMSVNTVKAAAVDVVINDCIKTTGNAPNCLQEAHQTVQNHAAHHGVNLIGVNIQTCEAMNAGGTCGSFALSNLKR